MISDPTRMLTLQHTYIPHMGIVSHTHAGLHNSTCTPMHLLQAVVPAPLSFRGPSLALGVLQH